MSVRYWARLGLDITRVSLAELVERGSRWAVAKLMDAPGGGLPGAVVGEAASPIDNLRFLSQEEEDMASIVRSRMRPAPKSRSAPAEDNPPNAPLVGSLEWRRQKLGHHPQW